MSVLSNFNDGELEETDDRFPPSSAIDRYLSLVTFVRIAAVYAKRSAGL